jgi:hypothetical protein
MEDFKDLYIKNASHIMTDQRAKLKVIDKMSMLRTNNVTERQASSKSSIEMMRMCLRSTYLSANIGDTVFQERVCH